jgi:hypothetical protein
MAWQMLQHPPVLNDQELMIKMQAFSSYFGQTWVTGSFPLKLWCHFENIGPRTTNLAEGWHNSLNHSFGMPHLSARNFLHWLQNCQYQVQCREVQLEAGRPTKPKSATYRDVDAKIANAKLQFGLRTGFLFLNIFQQQEMWGALSREILTYLRHVCYLIAGTIFD